MLAAISFLAASYQRHGEVDPGLALCALSTFLYLAKFYWWEVGYMRSIDIITDRAGFYETWGCRARFGGDAHRLPFDTRSCKSHLHLSAWPRQVPHLCARRVHQRRAHDGGVALWPLLVGRRPHLCRWTARCRAQL